MNYRQKLNDLDHLLDRNGVLCDGIARHALAYYKIPETELARFVRAEEKAGRPAERVNVVQALKHYVRDWSAEGGARERDPTFPCLLRTLARLYPDRGGNNNNNASAVRPRVLLPGAGLGRLGYELAAMGGKPFLFSCQLLISPLSPPPGAHRQRMWRAASRTDRVTYMSDDEGFEVTINEWSTYMTAAYRYLEAHPAPESHTFHPFLDSLSHHAMTADLQRPVTFPELDAVLTNGPSSVLLVEGDFTTVFSDDDAEPQQQKQQYDVIITYFFLDTARNLLSYLDTVFRLLRPGGHWLNLGPLLYGTGPWVQLSLDEIVHVSEAVGFEFLDDLDPAACGERTFPDKKEKKGALGKVRGKEAVYGSNARGLTKSSYMAQSWVARKAE